MLWSFCGEGALRSGWLSRVEVEGDGEGVVSLPRSGIPPSTRKIPDPSPTALGQMIVFIFERLQCRNETFDNCQKVNASHENQQYNSFYV